MTKNNPKWPLAAPRIALSPDGKDVVVYNETGEVIELPKKGWTRDDFEKAVEGKKLMGKKRTITLEAYMGNPVCQIWIEIDHRLYCFKVHCTTGAYLGMC